MRRGERILGPIAGNGTAQHAAIGSVTRLAHWRTNAGILHFFGFTPKARPPPEWLTISETLRRNPQGGLCVLLAVGGPAIS
jgi:hypothetical protein